WPRFGWRSASSGFAASDDDSRDGPPANIPRALPAQLLRRPPEGQVVAVGIGNVELTHAVGGGLGWLQLDAAPAQVLVRAIGVGTTEVDAGVVMGLDPFAVGTGGPLAVVVGGVEHHLRIAV